MTKHPTFLYPIFYNFKYLVCFSFVNDSEIIVTQLYPLSYYKVKRQHSRDISLYDTKARSTYIQIKCIKHLKDIYLP